MGNEKKINEREIDGDMVIHFIKILEKSNIVPRDSYKNTKLIETITAIISMSENDFYNYIKENPNRNVQMIRTEFNDWKQVYGKISEGVKNYLATAALGLGLMGTPNITKGSNLTQIVQNQSHKILNTVSFDAYQPTSNPDLDLVHGALGSNRLQDDFEKRVEQELSRQVKNGNTPSVSNIQVKTYVQGDRIITKASCDIIQSEDGIAYTHFTTRGSIGSNYDKRHDIQINGLINRLENYYGGVAKQIGNPIDISFTLNGSIITYRQSFFVASDTKSLTKINFESKEIIGSDINDLRNKLNSETQNIYIDVNSINVDMDNYKISYKIGNVKIYKISLLFDDSGNLQNRLKNVKIQNQTFKEIKVGKVGNLEWVVGLIPYEEKVNEGTKSLIKRIIREKFEIVKNVLDIQEPFDSMKTIKINGRNVYVLFGNVDYYENKESILALKRKSNDISINHDNYHKFLIEAKNRFFSIPELKNVGTVISIETTAPITDELSDELNIPYKKHGFLKQNSNFKMKDVPLDKRSEVKNLFNLNFDIKNNESICILDDFITTGTSFKNAFSLLPNNVDSVGVCLFILKS